MASFSLYAWLNGQGVALNALHNVENELSPYNTRSPGWKRYNVGIKSPPVDDFPVRFVKGSGREGGGGRIDHEWTQVITTYALDFVLDTYLSSGTVVDAAMTIYTRRHQNNTFARYNAYLVTPSVAAGDLEYLRQNVVRVRWRWRKLTLL